MNAFLKLLSNLSRISALIELSKRIYNLKNIFKKELPPQKPTATDLVMEALDLADSIAYDMETVKHTLNAIALLDDPKTEEERKKHPITKIREKFKEFGMDENTFTQCIEWVEKAEFCWSSFRDELRIMTREGMTIEQKKDIVTYKYKDKSK